MLFRSEDDMRRRDAADSARSLAPLKPAEDAVHIDSTDKPIEAVVDEMMAHIAMKKQNRGPA